MAKTGQIRKIKKTNMKTKYTDSDVSIICDDERNIYITDNAGTPKKVTDVYEFSQDSNKPTGQQGKFYFAKDTKIMYYFNGSDFVKINGEGGNGGTGGEGIVGGNYWGRDIVIGGKYTGTWDYGNVVITTEDQNGYESSGRTVHGDVRLVNRSNKKWRSGLEKLDCAYDTDTLGFYLTGGYKPGGSGSPVSYNSSMQVESSGITFHHDHSQRSGSYKGEMFFNGERLAFRPKGGSKTEPYGIVIQGDYDKDKFFVGQKNEKALLETEETININAPKGLYINGELYPKPVEGFVIGSLPPKSDPNTIIRSGVAFGQALKGVPYGENVTCLIETYAVNPNWILQRLQALGAGELYTRTLKDGKWDEWQLFIARPHTGSI